MLNNAGPPDGEALTEVSIKIGKNKVQRDFGWSRAGADHLSRALAENLQHLDPSCVLMAGEVVSPSSVCRDYVDKRNAYASVGIPSYMIVDLNPSSWPYVRHFLLDDSGRYRQTCAGGPGDRITFDYPFALSFDPAVLSATTRTSRAQPG